MSLKLKALLILAGVLSITFGGIFLLEYIAMHVSVETIKTAISVFIMGLLLYVTYGLILARLEYEQKLDEISKNIKEITNK